MIINIADIDTAVSDVLNAKRENSAYLGNRSLQRIKCSAYFFVRWTLFVIGFDPGPCNFNLLIDHVHSGMRNAINFLSFVGEEYRTQYPDRCQASSDWVHSTAPRGLGDSVVPRDHVLASDWIRNGKRLIGETRQSIVRTNLSYVHCAFIQFSDPVNLTDTSEMKIRKGFPSAVPWWSVEIRRGPAFL
jgi:hypothetical protein